jgi:hypothetical protein
MTMGELERWIGLEIAGKYHQNVHRGVHAIPAQLWDRSVRRAPPAVVTDPERFVIDFLPAETRRVGRNGFQINRIRYWDPLLARLCSQRRGAGSSARSFARSFEGWTCSGPKTSALYVYTVIAFRNYWMNYIETIHSGSARSTPP